MKKLLFLLGAAGIGLFAGVSVAQTEPERCVIPQRFLTPDYIPKLIDRNVVVKEVKYHAHIYSIDGDNLADMGVFFELDDYGKPLDHPERPKFYAFDFDRSNSFSLDELCEKRVYDGKFEWYKVKPEDLPKPKIGRMI